MDHKKYQSDGDRTGCCGKCLSCIMCCNLPASAGVKIVSICSILLGLAYCCLGVWTIIVTSSNDELPIKNQLYYETWTVESTPLQEMPSIDSLLEGNPLNENPVVTTVKKFVPLTSYYSYLIGLGVLSLSVGFVRTLSSIFLLWNSVEKHSRTPGRMWIFFTFIETTSIITYLLVCLNVTGFINDAPWSPVRVQNDKFSFYVLLTIFRVICFSDIFLTVYFIFIVLWFVRTR